MRFWFAVSGLCHVGLLLALSFWPRTATEPPSAPSPVVFACEGAPELASEIIPPEPDPQHSAPEPIPDDWPEELDEPDRPPDEFDAQSVETIHIPGESRLDPSVFTVRLRRPRRTQEPNPLPAPAPQRVHVIRGVTRAPVPVESATPIPYPRRALRRGLEGSVDLRIFVLRTGCVGRVVVLRSSGHAVLDEAARSSVARWRFAPALRNGDPVAAWTRRTVRFELTAKSR